MQNIIDVYYKCNFSPISDVQTQINVECNKKCTFRLHYLSVVLGAHTTHKS